MKAAAACLAIRGDQPGYARSAFSSDPEHEDITERRPMKRLDAEPVAGEGERTRVSKILPFPAHRLGRQKLQRSKPEPSGALESSLVR
jgi:hypothetical protein